MIKSRLFLVLFCCLHLSINFSLKNWNETCEHPDECFDVRMTCAPADDNVMRCLCNKFHKWNGQSLGCIQIYSVAYIMNQTIHVKDNEKKILDLQEMMFLGPVYSVIFMGFIIGCCFFSVIVYCAYIRKQDRLLKTSVHDFIANQDRNKRGLFQSSSQC